MAFKTAGSTFVFGGNVENLVDLEFSEDGTEIDVTNLASAMKEYETGIKDVELTVTVNGVSTIGVGDSDTATITWQSGESSAITSSICTSRKLGGAVDDAITTALTFKPTPAA